MDGWSVQVYFLGLVSLKIAQTWKTSYNCNMQLHMRHNDTRNTEKYRPQVYEEWLVGRGLVGGMCMDVYGGKDKSLSHSWWTLGQRSSSAMQAMWSDTTEKEGSRRVNYPILIQRGSDKKSQYFALGLSNCSEDRVAILSINYWRASLVPAAAVIPAPMVYANIVAVKKLVVEFLRESILCGLNELQRKTIYLI